MQSRQNKYLKKAKYYMEKNVELRQQKELRFQVVLVNFMVVLVVVIKKMIIKINLQQNLQINLVINHQINLVINHQINLVQRKNLHQKRMILKKHLIGLKLQQIEQNVLLIVLIQKLKILIQHGLLEIQVLKVKFQKLQMK